MASGLNKTYRIKLRLVREPGAGETLSGLRVLPVFDCGADASQGQCRAQQRSAVALSEGGQIEFITTVDFSWSGGDGTYKEIQPGQIQLKLALTGEDPNTVERSIFLSEVRQTPPRQASGVRSKPRRWAVPCPPAHPFWACR